jgi:Kunitz/Bovine pancreatic trypsin inhibitor domain
MAMNARNQPSLHWIWVVALALSAAACTITHEAPQGGTETGNPPVIDAGLISLVVSQDEVHVRGAPGAATPDATIEATSALTGAVFRGQAAADGSFDIRVDTPITDSFEVRASQSGRDSNTVHVVRGGASVGEGTQDELSCKQREQLAGAQMAATSESADTRCTRDEDCALVPVNSPCSDACSDVPVSTAGALEIQRARDAIASGLCKDFRTDGCNVLVLPCVPPPSGNVGCRDQRCQLVEPEPQPTPESCPAELPTPGATCGVSATETCEYGFCVVDARYEATCVDGRWAVNVISCWNNQSTPLPIPPPADCSSQFDQGTGTMPVAVYWFHPRVGACLQRSYFGMGGNDNRYASYEACTAACKHTGECPPNRVVTEVCVEPGPVGGCLRTAPGCALLCAEPNALCEDEGPGWWCTARGFCDASSPE